MTAKEPGIIDDFNATADAYANRRGVAALPTDLLLTKFSLLMNHKADTEKRQLTEELLNCLTKMLWHAADPAAAKYSDTDSGDFFYAPLIVEDAAKILQRLAEPKLIDLVPQDAASRLADVGLALLKKTENPATLDISRTYGSETLKTFRTAMITLATASLEYADLFKATAEKVMDVTTSQPVSPSKPLALKKPPENA